MTRAARGRQAHVLVAGLVLIAAACAPTLMVKRDVSISSLAIYVDCGDSLDKPTVESLQTAARSFVNEYNTENHRLRLLYCAHDTSPALRVNVAKTGLVGPGKQAAGCIVSTIGLITPFAMLAAGMPFIVWFAYIPSNHTAAELTLTADIAANAQPISRQFTSSPYFGGLDTQRHRHAGAFRAFLRGIVNEVERSLGK